MDVGQQIDIANYVYLEGLLAAVDDDGEYEIMIRVEMPLVEKWSIIMHGYISATLNIGNYLWLK